MHSYNKNTKISQVTSVLTVLVIFLLHGCSIQLGGRPGPPLTEEEILQLNNPSPELLTQVEGYLGPVLDFITLAELNSKKEGRMLSDSEVAFAKQIGIVDVDSIRIVVTSSFPMPENFELKTKFEEYRLDSWFNKGITLGNAIYIKPRSANNPTIIKHELAHVMQYGRMGKREFLKQVLLGAEVVGSWNSMPHEVEAYALQETLIQTE
jgi:hypothetical protein